MAAYWRDRRRKRGRRGTFSGELTTSGVLEVYMGHYTREWLVAQGLIPSGECPAPDTVQYLCE